MKRIAVVILIVLSVSGPARAQTEAGFLALTSEDGTRCGVTDWAQAITYRVYYVPGPVGATNVSFKIEFPPNVQVDEFWVNTGAVQQYFGSPESGIVITFGMLTCETDTVWILEQYIYVENSDQSTIEVVPYPSHPTVELIDCYDQHHEIFGTPLLINQDIPCISCDVAPDSIDFGQVELGQGAVDSTFQITNTGVFPLTSNASESCPDYSVLGGSYYLMSGDSTSLTVSFEPVSAGTLDCTIDTGYGICNDVACTGVGLGVPDCQIVPTSIDFGTVVVGGSKDKTFTVTNTGIGSGFLTGTVTTSCSHYSVISDASYNLGAGEWKDFTLRFEPSVEGIHLCTVETGDSLCVDIDCIGFACPAEAERFYVDIDAAGTNDGSSWLDAYTDLQSALAAAALSPCRPSDIWVAEGIYKPTAGASRDSSFQLQDGVAVYGGFAGGETTRDQRDWAANETVLSGDIGAPGVSTDNSYHVVASNGVDSTAVLDGFTITGGYADVYGVQDRGAGMRNDNANPTILNVVFSGNYAYTSGGGIYNDYSSPRVVNVVFVGNSTTYKWSGGAGMANAYSDPTLVNVTFSQNNAGNGVGGGMHGYQSDPTLVNTVFWGNVSGGGYKEINNNTSAPNVSFSLVEGGLTPGCIDGGNNIDADPGFVDAPNGNLRVWSSSPVLEVGDDAAVAGVTTDLDCNARIYGTHVDMGAYEYQGLPTGIDEDPKEVRPRATALRGVYPNPFNPTLTVEFDLDRRRPIQIAIYDVGGRLIRILLDEVRGPGTYSVLWNGRDDSGNSMASGVYFVRARSEEWRVIRKVVLLK